MQKGEDKDKSKERGRGQGNTRDEKRELKGRKCLDGKRRRGDESMLEKKGGKWK